VVQQLQQAFIAQYSTDDNPVSCVCAVGHNSFHIWHCSGTLLCAAVLSHSGSFSRPWIYVHTAVTLLHCQPYR
jgi:hypothetical protein